MNIRTDFLKMTNIKNNCFEYRYKKTHLIGKGKLLKPIISISMMECHVLTPKYLFKQKTMTTVVKL